VGQLILVDEPLGEAGPRMRGCLGDSDTRDFVNHPHKHHLPYTIGFAPSEAMTAAKGELATKTDAQRAVYQRINPTFTQSASMIIHPGEPGAGTRTKLARNTLTLTSYAAACKAPKFAEAARLDPQPPRPEVQVRHTDARTGSPRAITAPNDIKHLEPNNFPYQPLHHTRGPGQKHLSPAAALAQPLTVDPPLTHPHGQTAPPRPRKMNNSYA
jgi:hypothetical protein